MAISNKGNDASGNAFMHNGAINSNTSIGSIHIHTLKTSRAAAEASIHNSFDSVYGSLKELSSRRWKRYSRDFTHHSRVSHSPSPDMNRFGSPNYANDPIFNNMQTLGHDLDMQTYYSSEEEGSSSNIDHSTAYEFKRRVYDMDNVIDMVWTDYEDIMEAMKPFKEKKKMRPTWKTVIEQALIFTQNKSLLQLDEFLRKAAKEDQNHKVICDALQDISREVGSALSASKSLASLLQKVKAVPTRRKAKALSGTGKSFAARKRLNKKPGLAPSPTSPPRKLIDDRLESLVVRLCTARKCVDNLASICSQIRDESQPHSDNYTGMLCHPSQRSKVVGEYVCARKASCILYRWLCEHCISHTAHIVDFNLETTQNEGNDNGMTEVNFEFAVRLDMDSSSQRNAFSLRVKATDELHAVKDFNDISTVAPPTHSHCHSAQQGMSFQVCLLQVGQPVFSQAAVQSAVQLLGRINGRHDLYSSVRMPLNQRATRLADIIEGIRFNVYSASPSDVLHLATMISTAVLKFNCTPWLHGFWNSDDIFVFCKEGEPFSNPHFQARVVHPHNLDSRTSNTEGQRRVLFSLGIVLYELWGLRRVPKLEALFSAATTAGSQSQMLTLRKRIQHDISGWTNQGRMRPEYAEVVRCCIRVNIGVDEMDNSETLATLHESVICKLVTLQKEFSKPVEDFYPF